MRASERVTEISGAYGALVEVTPSPSSLSPSLCPSYSPFRLSIGPRQPGLLDINYSQDSIVGSSAQSCDLKR